MIIVIESRAAMEKIDLTIVNLSLNNGTQNDGRRTVRVLNDEEALKASLTDERE